MNDEIEIDKVEHSNSDKQHCRHCCPSYSVWKEGLMGVIAVGLGLLLAYAAMTLLSPKVVKVEAPTVEPVGSACWGSDRQALSAKDIEKAKIAWKYFENNYQKKTGLVNSVDKYPSTTMWDTGSALAGTISAFEIGLINQKQFDDRVMAMLSTISKLKLYDGVAPNKAYDTTGGFMVDYANKKAPDGIGVSTLDLARLVSWLNVLSCGHPKYKYPARKILLSWDYTELIKEGQMYGIYRNRETKKSKPVQEGRLGYEQYAGKVFESLGFDQSVAATYENKHRRNILMYDIPIAYDNRDPRDLGAYNYVVTESFILDGMEHGLDAENTDLINNVYQVQKSRWQDQGIITAVSEDNVNQSPWFIYNTIFSTGKTWNTTTDKGKIYNNLKSVSTKAAFSMASFFNTNDYSPVLVDAISSAYNPERGWYSGVYENGSGYNTAITANTNGIMLQSLLYKTVGTLATKCYLCDGDRSFYEDWLDING